jgi:hypothetical protein
MYTGHQEYYTPKHPISVTATENREVRTHGQIKTTYRTENNVVYGWKRPYVEGEIKSDLHILSYTVRITYDGPVNIGDRQLRSQNIPNYWDDKGVAAEVYKITGVQPDAETACPASCYACGLPYPYSSMQCNSIYLASAFCCACLFVLPFYCKDTSERKQAYLAELERVASERMGRDVASLVEAADKSVNERISYMQNQNQSQSQINIQNSGPQQPGLITLTNEQLQMLLAQGRPQVPIDLGNNNMNNQAVQENGDNGLKQRLL